MPKAAAACPAVRGSTVPLLLTPSVSSTSTLLLPGARRSRLAAVPIAVPMAVPRSEEHTSELQSPCNLVCRLLLEKKKNKSHNCRITKLTRVHTSHADPQLDRSRRSRLG